MGRLVEFHYVRHAGREGGVARGRGPAAGVELETILADGVPPWRSALDLLAAVLEILAVAEKDGAAHGALAVDRVVVEEGGAVAVDGFLGPADGVRTASVDAYGVGLLAFRVLAGRDLPETGDDHDDDIARLVQRIDAAGLPGPSAPILAGLLASLLAGDPAHRPALAEAWREAVGLAEAAGGDRLERWLAAALEGGGARRAAGLRPDDSEVLSDASGRAGPLPPGATLGGASGASTSFWNRPDAARHAQKPRRHGAALAREPLGTADAIALPEELSSPPVARRPTPIPPPVRPEGGGMDAKIEYRTARPVRTATPTARQSVGESRRTASPGRFAIPIVLALGLGMAVCAGVVVVAGVVAATIGDAPDLDAAADALPVAAPSPAPPSPPPVSAVEVPEPPPEPEPEPEVASAPAPAAMPSAPPPPPPSAQPAARPPQAPVTRPRPAAAPPPPPPPAPSEGPAKVTFRSNHRGQIRCVGVTTAFDGAATLQVESYQLPATCLVEMDRKRGVFQILGSGAIGCDLTNGAVVCDRATVP